jgi:hypothetical protein
MARQFSAKPIRKVAGGALAGAATSLFVWLLKSISRVDVPADVASALTVIVTFAVSYRIPASDEDLIQVAADGQSSAAGHETLTGFEVSLEARADHGMQALVYTNRLIAGHGPAIR